MRVKHISLRVLFEKFESLFLKLHCKHLAFFASLLFMVVQILTLFHYVKLVLVNVNFKKRVHKTKLRSFITKLLCIFVVFTSHKYLNSWLIMFLFHKQDDLFFHHPWILHFFQKYIRFVFLFIFQKFLQLFSLRVNKFWCINFICDIFLLNIK